jgi:hypothetical protein
MDPEELAGRVIVRADELIPAQPRADFSDDGYIEFMKTAAAYISDFANETYREMRRNHADRVTPMYVRSASSRLTTGRRSRLNEILISFGGILLGAGISIIPAWATTATVSTGQAVVVAAFIAAGIFMLMVGFLRR